MLRGPGVDAAGHVGQLRKAVLVQEGGHALAAGAVVAQAGDALVLVELGQARGDLVHRDRQQREARRGDARGRWNEGPEWEFVEAPQPAVDGGDGLPSVNVTQADVEVLGALAERTASDTESDPMTGADLGSGKQPG